MIDEKIRELVNKCENELKMLIDLKKLDDIPYSLINEKLIKGPSDSYVEIRFNHPKAGVHIAVFIDES